MAGYTRLPIGKQALRRRCDEIGRAIVRDYREQSSGLAAIELTLIGIASGGQWFARDLIRALCDPETGVPPSDLQLRAETILARSYSDATQSDELEFSLVGLRSNSVTDKHVLLVDDIIDSGQTLATVSSEVAKLRPRSIGIAVLLDKPDRRQPQFKVDVNYCGFRIANEFVVGNGMDFDGLYRTLTGVVPLRDVCPEFHLPAKTNSQF